MSVKLLAEHHLEFLSLGGCIGLSESTLVIMTHCRKSRVMAHIQSGYLPLCMLGKFSCFCCHLLTFSKLTFSNISFRNTS